MAAAQAEVFRVEILGWDEDEELDENDDCREGPGFRDDRREARSTLRAEREII